jgi:hypothetical protein
MPLTILVNREAKKEVGEYPCERDDASHGWPMEGYDFVASRGWENSMNNKHLRRLFARALSEKQLELFDEFLHLEEQ